MYLHGFCKVVTSVVAVGEPGAAMYLHGFCKVVTSGQLVLHIVGQMYLHGFCKVVTSELNKSYKALGCTCMDFVRLSLVKIIQSG